MENATYIVLSRQLALRRDLAVTANNMANVNTPGFKAERTLFVSYLMDGGASGQEDAGFAMVQDRATVRDMRPGRLDRTENPFNVAVMGDGYLVVETPAGPRYTRNGQLAQDADGRLVGVNGLPLLDTNDRPIRLPADAANVTITGSGDVVTEQGPVATLNLVRFDDEANMLPLGGGLMATNEVPKPAEGASLAQGVLEQSNVEPISEMTELIRIARQYQSTQRLLESEHERQKMAIQRLGRTQSA